ncbi:glutamine ABC superfamily ATP binding cassette transporter, substrate binding protein [Agrilactobacillus composti DSM 18527 = JCM 14202]|uniref:Glutamine ABC superfamily ATP binding cassette transporter, substrate binding protein n=1 Tax=Agrilactobacillus composti DSM 18527 = JCM 14202 TaxID=1423734 RepID=A0A0R1Y4W4_9LACO|nr:glutamine ABC superfamily ATP binding cassette transporter, substrate binding protein [Agrilactobacillus composti DSM 18527 = JCM 14202]
MKKKNWLLIPMLLVLGLTVLAGCGQKSVASEDVLARDKANKTVVWGVKSDTRLFGLMDIKTNQIQGFDIDIAKELSHRIYGKDVKIDLVPVTSNTRLPLLKNGNVDALIATMTITPERQKQVDFSDVYFDAGQAILVKKGSPIKSVKDLKAGTKVIGVQGSNSVDNVKKAAPDTRVLQLADYAQAFTALKSGQGDALTTDNGILYGMSSDDPNYVVVGGTFTNEPYGIAVNKGQKPFLKAINKNLKAMRQDGTYHKIEQKWFGKIQGFHQGR